MINLARKIWKIFTGNYDSIDHIDDTTNQYLYNLFSYCQNEFLKNREGIDPQRLEYHRKIHEFLCVKKLVSGDRLIRVGNAADGGYSMASKTGKDWKYSRSKIAYSLGICTDVSWDLHMAENGYEVFQYDHTIKRLPQTNPHFHWEKVGISDGEETNNLRKIENLIIQNGHVNENGMLLKSDIEGYEWGMIDGISMEMLERFDQIVIELHDFILSDWENKNRIIRALEKLSHSFIPVHLHANNNNPVEYCGDYVTPNLLEITFVKKGLFTVEEDEGYWPKSIDKPNKIELQDIFLGKWNI